MKIAVMSCIHGNYEALNAVLSDIDEQRADKIFCLGDLVGYGPDPNGVVEMIRSMDIPTVQGCWDEDIVEGLNACECSYPSILAEKRGKKAHEWTNDQIHPEVREYLAQMPLTLRENNLCFVHGSPHNQHEYLMPEVNAFTADELTPNTDPIQMLDRLSRMEANQLFCGRFRKADATRTGLTFEYLIESGSLTSQVQTLDELAPQTAAILNPQRIIGVGSIGRVPGLATYTLYHPGNNQVQFKTIRYGSKKGFG